MYSTSGNYIGKFILHFGAGDEKKKSIDFRVWWHMARVLYVPMLRAASRSSIIGYIYIVQVVTATVVKTGLEPKGIFAAGRISDINLGSYCIYMLYIKVRAGMYTWSTSTAASNDCNVFAVWLVPGATIVDIVIVVVVIVVAAGRSIELGVLLNVEED